MATLNKFRGLAAVDIFFENVSRIMAEKHISQSRLAELMGCKQPSISRMLTNKSNISIESIEAIAHALDVPIQELFEKSLIHS